MLKVTLLTTSIFVCSILILNFIQRQVADCPARLAVQGYTFETLSGYDGYKCRIEEPIKLHSTPTTTLTSPVTLSCSFAEAFGDWAADIGAKKITHMGGYNCRRIADSIFKSQHSYGNAIDISVIDDVSISSKWEEPAKKACRHFTNIQTPTTNAAHQDHLHLDKGMGLPCWANKLKLQFLVIF